jgi:hypothetical protein
MSAGRLDLRADRHTPYFPDLIDFPGVDFTGATILLEVRQVKDTEGPALISLTDVEDEQGVYISTSSPGGLITTHLQIFIFKEVMEALPYPAERGEDLVLWWDLLIQPPSLFRKRWLQGKFIVEAGVSI